MKNILLLLISVFLLDACSMIKKNEERYIVAQICVENIKFVELTTLNLIKENKNSTEYITPGRKRAVLVNCDSNNTRNSIIGLGNASDLVHVFINLEDSLSNGKPIKDFKIYNSEWSNWENYSNTKNIDVKIRFKSLLFQDYLPYREYSFNSINL